MVMRMMIILLQLVLVMIVAASPSPSPSSGDTVMCRPDERDALLSFKSAFSIDNSSHLYCRAKTKSWEKDGNCCEWDGVTCDPHTGHVVELDLFGSCLSGSFPSNTTLFRLPNLQSLNLTDNFLSGQVPQEIGWLSHLTYLSLTYNDQLTMPNFQTIISNLTDLIELDLSSVNIATHLPPIIYNLSNLELLDLSGCNLIGDFPSTNVDTSMLARVTDIYLSHNMLTGVIPGWLFTLPSMSFLSLSNNLFTRISKFEIGNASSLTFFEADSNHLQGNILDSIFELHNLTSLDLQQNNLTGTIPLSRFRKLQHLTELGLSDNSFTIIDDMDIANSKPSWPDLNYLSLSSCNLGHFPGFIREYRNLEILELSNNGITGLVPNWIFEIGTLTFLNLSHNSLQGGLENLPWQGMLESVDIQYNMFHGIVPIPPPTTKSFWASNNHFTGEPPSSLCNVNGLELLDLARNNLIGNIPECIASLIRVDWLYWISGKINPMVQFPPLYFMSALNCK